METTIDKDIYDISLRVRLYRASRRINNETGALSDREFLLMQFLHSKEKEMSISEIIESCPAIGMSTISATITKLWKNKLVSKRIPVDNQRITMVQLTKKGETKLKELKENQRHVFTALIEALNLTDEEHLIFKNVLDRANNYFNEILFGSSKIS